MNQINILPTDKFKIVSKALPSEFQLQTITKLYQPLIGVHATALYTTLVNDLQGGNIAQLGLYSHEQLLVDLGIKMADLLDAKAKLEAVGLLQTKIKQQPRELLYQLIPAKNGHDFFQDPVLSSLLMEYVGDQRFAQLLEFFEGNHWNEQAYTDVSTSFVNVFGARKETQIKPVSHSEAVAQLPLKLDVGLLQQLLSKTFVNFNAVSENLAVVNTVAIMYGLDEVQIVRLLEASVDVNRQDMVNWNRFRSLAADQFQFVGQSETSQDQSSKKADEQPQSVKLDTQDQALVDACVQYAPMEFLAALKDEQGQTITREEQITISRAVEAARLSPAVINVLIHYMLVDQNMGSLNQKFFERTANNWLKNKINTPVKAIAYVRQWQKQRQITMKKKTNFYSAKQFQEKLPQWALQQNKQPTQSQSSKLTENQLNQDIDHLIQRINNKTTKRGDH